MAYKAVIFDLFGTVIDNFSDSEYAQILGEMASSLNAPVQEFSQGWRGAFNVRANGTLKTFHDSIRYVCGEIGINVTEEQVQKASDIRLGYSRKTIVPRPATLPTITELKTRGYKVGLVSDCSPETPEVWPETQLNGIFDVTVFSCVVSMKKPDPRIYLYACEKLGVNPEDCLYVGDGSSNELTGAAVVGMHPVLVRDPGENDDTHFVDREEDWNGDVIATLDEILKMV